MTQQIIPHMMTEEVVRQLPDMLVPQPFVQTVEKFVEAPQAQKVERSSPVPQGMMQEVLVPVAVPKEQVVDVDRFVDVPVVLQWRVSTIQRVEKAGEVPQVHCNDNLVNVPVAMQRNVHSVHAAQKTVEVPQFQILAPLRGTCSLFQLGSGHWCAHDGGLQRVGSGDLPEKLCFHLWHPETSAPLREERVIAVRQEPNVHFQLYQRDVTDGTRSPWSFLLCWCHRVLKRWCSQGVCVPL